MSFTSKLLTVVLLSMFGLLVFLQYRLWCVHGILHVRSLSEKVAMQRMQNSKMQQHNAYLQIEIDALKNTPDALEERARFDLGMVKPDETFYQFLNES